jgi:hypothetical protein
LCGSGSQKSFDPSEANPEVSANAYASISQHISSQQTAQLKFTPDHYRLTFPSPFCCGAGEGRPLGCFDVQWPVHQ